jgi:hypothetical protein
MAFHDYGPSVAPLRRNQQRGNFVQLAARSFVEIPD